MKNIKNFLYWFQSFFFVFILLIPFIFSYFNWDTTFSKVENRLLATKPKFSLELLIEGKWGKEVEAFLEDHILARNLFVEISTYGQILLGNEEVNGVILGKDGYLFEKVKYNDIIQEDVNKNIGYINQFISKHSNVYVGLIPSSIEIYKNKVSKYIDSANQKELINSIYNNLETKNFLNIYDELVQHSKENIYYKTDHHWTTLGAYYGYCNIVSNFDMEPYSRNQFKLELLTDNFRGSRYSKLNSRFIESEYMFAYIPIFDIEYQKMINEDSKTLTNSLYDYDKLGSSEQYAVFLGGNQAIVRIRTNLKDAPRILIVKDSFSHCLTPFLVNHFSEVVLLDMRYLNLGVEQFIKLDNEFDYYLILYSLENFLNTNTMLSLTR